MIRKVLGSKIHRATVTQSNVDYEGSIAMPPKLIESAKLLPYEAVQIWNVTSGTRFETYAINSGKNDGEICINGAAAHLANPGDIIIIARFIWLDENECKEFQPTVVFVDRQNQIREIKSVEANIYKANQI